MEDRARTQGLLLAGLAVLLAAALWWNFGGDGQAPAAGDPARPAAQTSRGGRAVRPADAVVESVALGVLESPAPEPTPASRNPFRFEAPARPAASDDEGGSSRSGGPGGPPAPAIVSAPPGPPPTPPIPLRFIGTVDEAARHLKLAVLSDGRNVFYGREGDIIEGRYRIVRIGVESIEMMHVDGRGQQTIRLSGS